MVNGKIRASTNSDAPSQILGIIRPKNMAKGSSVIGGAHAMEWQGKYLTDDYGQYIMEPYTTVRWEETLEDGTKKSHNYESDKVPAGIVVPSDVVPNTVFGCGTPLTRQKLNPAYDPTKTYVSRENRNEWHIVGLLGQIPMTKGQITGTNWVKMKDISDTVEMWFVK
jgi:hypothetical protein